MFLPVSQATADGNELDKHRVPYKVIPNFVPDHIDVIEDDNPLLSQLPKGDFLLFVGDVTQDKGAEVLLRAYAEMETQVPLVLIGRPFLTGLDSWLPKNVFLMGTWPHEAVMGAWKRCIIGLVPSTWAEPFGIVALEAMYMGKPLIAAHSGGLTDIVAEGETGLFVPPGDHQALRIAIQTLLDNPGLRERMGAQAKQRIRAFQAESVVSRFEQVYQELIETDPTGKTIEITTGSR
jgi:glycosyltransferase involved in cell wall biosynthesis